MQNADDSNAILTTQAPVDENSLVDNAPSFPFLTKLWIKGNVIAAVIGILIVVGSMALLGGKTGDAIGLLAGILLGAIYGLMIWFLIRFYSEFAGVFLNVEESTRITADILSRMEAKQSVADAGKEITERT